MRPIVPISAGALVLAVGLGLAEGLSPLQRAGAWSVLGASYLAIATWGVAFMSSGLFGRVHVAGDPRRREVALTWDDGPDPLVTPLLLDLLAARGVQGTFFCVGSRARAHADLVARIAREGHGVENHSNHHEVFTNFLFGRAMRRELTACQSTLEELSGSAPRYYRPPMGLMNHAVPGAARASGLELVGWQVRSLDTTRAPADEVIARVMRRVRAGGIVLLHDGGQDPERALAIARGILDGLAAKGLTPVRLDRLLR